MPPQERSITTAVTLLLLGLFAVGCSGPDDAGPSGEAADGTAAARPEQPHVPEAELGEIEREDLGLSLPWTNGRISRDPPEDAPPSPLRRLSFSRVAAIDRLVFAFDSADAFPGYVVESSLGALPGCEAGDSVTARGEGLLRIRLHGAAADPDVAGDAVRRPDLDNVETVRRCTRDETVEWVLDIRRATTYRVLRASNPPRLAVDVLTEVPQTSEER